MSRSSRSTTRRRSAPPPDPRRPRLHSSEFGADVLKDVVAQLDRIERDGGSGELRFPHEDLTLPVTSLGKTYFPEPGLTKGDVMRFYVRLAPALLPAIADRPLVLRRYPNGVAGPSFHQHDPGEHTPESVRVAEVPEADGSTERRLVGGDPERSLGQALATLLYSVQLGAIPVNAWHSRVGSLDTPDYAVLDLDPDPKAGFARVIEVGRAVHAELERRGLRSAPKTSGSRGVHMLIPLAPGTTFDESAALAEEVATAVARAHPKIATVERGIDERPRGTVYVDHMQNAAGKTLVAVFSVRARPEATVSTPLTWRQVSRTLDPNRYTIATVTRQRAALMSRWRAAMDE
jgi:bifunctional non-homologous end joining protein LigD